ncbi:MAG: RNA polymerase-associated protein RapA [Fibrobacter sp.]|nr:RNA polymerase-associated protein RapA [Fibrobacter sp.]
MNVFRIGQRWISVNEMELGLGRVMEIEGRFVVIEFPASSEIRTYNKANAPLKRFILEKDDTASDEKGNKFNIAKVEVEEGLLRYFNEKGEILIEEDLNHRISVKRADLFDKMIQGQSHPLKHFLLREKLTQLNFKWLGSPVRGMIGPRVDLISHQYYISHRGSISSDLPRFMLSDEVGLGKTIEAGMIWHSLRTRQRITKTLVIVPESLKLQWVLEMLRRFNHFFTLVDLEYIQSLEPIGDDPMPNPFTTRNEMICTFEYLLEEPSLYHDLLEVDWDLVIVDEAHHLRAEDGEASPEFVIVSNIADKTKGLLFLTATPLQLDEESHFNRLRLLDPSRYQEYSQYQKEQSSYQTLVKDLNDFVDAQNEKNLTWESLDEAIPAESQIRPWLDNVSSDSLEAGEWVRRIVDALGTGSTIFRNTRKNISGFPQRILHAYPLEANPEYRNIVSMSVDKFLDDSLDFSINGMLGMELPEIWELDERVAWLENFLNIHKKEKILLICSDIEVVLNLAKILSKTIAAKDFVLFHEQMELLSRDRAATHFAHKDGARLLISSEIGSEGRNFQFASHLILFDLPLQATLLEQRIGRLDRIGQGNEVHIHVPYAKGSGLESLFVWYHEVFDAFQRPFMGSEFIYKKHQDSLLEAIIVPQLLPSFREEVIPTVKRDVEQLRIDIELGRDRLLEYNSFNKNLANELVNEVDEFDADDEFYDAIVQALEEFGVDVEEASLPRSLLLRSTPQLKVEIPGLFERSQAIANVSDSEALEDEFGNRSNDAMVVSLDRYEALNHDEVEFLSWEHPIAQGVFDLGMETEFGSVSIAGWQGAPEKQVLMQFNFIHEIPTASHWGISDLTAPKLIKVLVNATGKDYSAWLEKLSPDDFKPLALKPGASLEARVKQFATKGLEAAKKLAEDQSEQFMRQSLDQVSERLDKEYQRAQYLLSLKGKTRNSSLLKTMRSEGIERRRAVQNPQLRLDSVCLLVCV